MSIVSELWSEAWRRLALIDWKVAADVAVVFTCLFTLILAIGVPVTVNSARKSQKKSEADSFYAQLDNIYYDIQKLIIAHPHLALPDDAKTREQRVQYDAFAFMVWNFLEAIYDYSKDSEFLRRTWGVILSYEARLHGKWFAEDRNVSKFKPEFRAYVQQKLLPA